MSYFLNTDEIVQTIRMIEQEHLDVRTITLGLSLLDCATGDIKRTAVQCTKNFRHSASEFGGTESV